MKFYSGTFQNPRVLNPQIIFLMKKTEQILRRIIQKTGIPNLMDILTRQLSATDFQSLLLQVFQKRIYAITPQQLLKYYEENRFVQPSAIDPLHFLAFDQMAFQDLPAGFERMELAPVAPLGTCKVVATVNQDKVLTALRNTEVVSDCTNVMALECALRRKKLLKKQPKSNQQIKLACTHRLTRAQPLKEVYHTATFRLFCMATAGKDEGDQQFEMISIREHFEFYISFLQSFFKKKKVDCLIRCRLTPLNEHYKRIRIQQQIFEPLKNRFPKVSFEIYTERNSGRGYYQDFCFTIQIVQSDGTAFDFIDGGLTDWTQQLVVSKKERLLISAMGSEMMLKVFGGKI